MLHIFTTAGSLPKLCMGKIINNVYMYDDPNR